MRGVEIEPGVIDRHAEFAGTANAVQEAGRVQQRLGGNAPPVQARAAQFRVLFHHRHPQAQLPRPDSGHVAARAAANDDEVHLFRHQNLLLPIRLRLGSLPTWGGPWRWQSIRSPGRLGIPAGLPDLPCRMIQ